MEITLTERERIQDAKAREARAWINSGSAPYQAARHCGFKTVALMQEAIRKLEEHEGNKNEPTVLPALPGSTASRPYTPPRLPIKIEDMAATMTAAPIDPPKPGPMPTAPERPAFQPNPKQYEPDNVIRSRHFCIEYFKAKDGHNEQVRVKLVKRPGFIAIRREDLLKLANLLNTMADLLDKEEI